VSQLRACAELAHKAGALVVVDNTFCSPYIQRPIELGADIVVHSTTKFLNGHSDSVGGAVITKSDEVAEKLGFLQNAVGAILSPFDSWLVLRGIKTLAVRMKQHEENGMAMAQYLSRHKKVKKIYYPGLATHPQHELAKKQMNGFGSMISFELGSKENAKKFLDRVRLCSLAESLGGVESLISHPESMTHGSVPPETRQRLGITPGLVRISVGIEDIEDLIADVDHAFEGV
jgi:cystathionine beta-lyase/cystathionine gamma-synthase